MTLDPRLTPIGSLGSVGTTRTSPLVDLIDSAPSGDWGDSIDEDGFGSNETTKSSSGSPSKAEATMTAEAYFNHVKEGLTKIQQDELQSRITNLVGTLEIAPREQRALHDETQRLLAVSFLQQKAAVLGYDTMVTRDRIAEFQRQVEFRRPELMKLGHFPRVIPAGPLQALKQAQDATLFDEFYVLTWNPKEEQVRSVTDRIIKKDPILFGQFAFDPDVFYYIASWEDETCDLTFAKMVDQLKVLHPDYEPAKVVPLKEEDAAYLIDAARKRALLLERTHSRSYRSDAIIADLIYEPFSWSKAGRVLKALWQQWRRGGKPRKKTYL